MNFNFENKKIFITGGTGGIGHALVNGFLNAGADIFFTSSSEEKIQNLKKEICPKDNQIFEGGVCDMSDFQQISDVSKSALKIFNNDIDVLICNAGTNLDKLSLRMDMSEWLKVININLNANFKLISEFLRKMVLAKKGRIILLSSIIGSTGNLGQANYSASKAGLEGMMKSIATEVAKSNVTVNAIAPGFIKTPMTDKLPEEIKSDILRKIPMGRFGETEEIFNLAAFLASNESSFITGQTIHINGGMYFG